MQVMAADTATGVVRGSYFRRLIGTFVPSEVNRNILDKHRY
jgi:hypothetical protein